MIGDVRVSPRRVTRDFRGDVMHFIRTSDDVFTEFGEVYFSKILVGQSKTWRRHRVAVSQLVVPIGTINILLFDDRTDSPSCGMSDKLTLGERDYQLITIPPLVWYAFENQGTETALIANCSSLSHDPSESDRREFSDTRMPQLLGH